MQLHGGEPLLLSKRYWFKFFEELDKLGWDSKVAVQSNFLSYDEDKKELLNEFLKSKMLDRIGTSYDFFTSFRKADRDDRYGSVYYNKWLSNIKKIQDDFGIKIMVNVVISKQNYNRTDEIIDKCYDLGLDVKFNHFYHMDFEKMLTPDEYTLAFWRAYLSWKRKEDSNFVFVNGQDFENIVYGKPVRLCYYHNSCSETFTCISPNGDVVTCGCGLSLGQKPYANPLNNKFFYDRFMELKMKEINLPEECFLCGICFNGCKLLQKNGKFIYCESLKTIISRVKKFLHTEKEPLHGNIHSAHNLQL